MFHKLLVCSHNSLTFLSYFAQLWPYFTSNSSWVLVIISRGIAAIVPNGGWPCRHRELERDEDFSGRGQAAEQAYRCFPTSHPLHLPCRPDQSVVHAVPFCPSIRLSGNENFPQACLNPSSVLSNIFMFKFAWKYIFGVRKLCVLDVSCWSSVAGVANCFDRIASQHRLGLLDSFLCYHTFQVTTDLPRPWHRQVV
jgi:hypothetical protein